MKRIKRTSVILFCLLVATMVVSCGWEPSGQAAVDKDKQITNAAMTQLLTNQPTPKFDYSQDRDVLIQIYVAKNEARMTYSSIDSITGQHLFDCPSIGFAIPADTQLTNPLQSIGYYSAPAVVEQAEPNGLYSSKNTDGTYVLCVRKNGDIVPIYTEQKVTTFPFPVQRQTDGSYKDVSGESGIKVKLGK